MSAFRYGSSPRMGLVTPEDPPSRPPRLPDVVWACIDDRAEDRETLESNRWAFHRYRLRARVLTGNEATDLRTTVAGARLFMPVLLFPRIGLTDP